MSLKFFSFLITFCKGNNSPEKTSSIEVVEFLSNLHKSLHLKKTLPLTFRCTQHLFQAAGQNLEMWWKKKISKIQLKLNPRAPQVRLGESERGLRANVF